MCSAAQSVAALRQVLLDDGESISLRYRALFSLKHLAHEHDALQALCDVLLHASSELLKHEAAYCLGQTRDERCLGVLTCVLQDGENQPEIARHEAAEALGAIGSASSLLLLEKMRDDATQSRSIRETCELAIERINWLKQHSEMENLKYNSVDPAPAFSYQIENDLVEILNSAESTIFCKYRALFNLRNLGTRAAIDAIAEAMHRDASELLRHECAFIFGQMSDDYTAEALMATLENTKEADMVRHEAAEALGSLSRPDVEHFLVKYCIDKSQIVRESCVVAVDMWKHQKSEAKEYALIL